jgi:hypothetical protein
MNIQDKYNIRDFTIYNATISTIVLSFGDINITKQVTL